MLSYHVLFDTFLGELEDVAYQTTVAFVDDQPVIDWAPNLIFPDMTGKDKINIQEDTAERGEIIDRNGEKLATNRDYQQLGLNPNKLGEGTAKEQHLKAISEAFAVSVDQLNDALAPEWAQGDVFVPVKTLYGEDKFREGLSKFIFDEELDLPFYMEPASISNEKSFATDIILADTGYEQGELLISPIQQATMSVFMNDGQLTYPRLMNYQKTEVKEQVISKKAATTILTDLVHSVSDEDGYVHQFYTPDFVLSAKTGTAEIKEKQDATGIENSFLLYFDTENKEFMGITMVEDARENGTAIEHSGDLVNYLEKRN